MRAITVSPGVANSARLDDVADPPLSDGSILVRVPCANLPAFRSWVLGLLDDAVVLEPPEVRDDVVQWLAAMATGPTPA